MEYDQIIAAVRSLAMPGQTCRVIFLSDSRTAKLQRHILPEFQQMGAENPHIVLHTIGFGDCDFSILQQLAQIGRGSFSRASTDIDNLVNTFTSLSQTITQTRNDQAGQERATRIVMFDSATRFEFGRKQIAFSSRMIRVGRRFTFDLYGGQLRQRSVKKCYIYMHENPFMQGGMRLIYRCQDTEIPTRMVAKFSRYEEDDNSWDYVYGFVKNVAKTRELGQMFHNNCWSAWDRLGYSAWEPPRLVSCAQTWVYELPPKPQQGSQLFIGEPFLEGSEKGFLKWINNRGEILIPPGSSDFSMAVEAFAHFSLDQSGGQLMVSDLQGVLKLGTGDCRRVHLTDPQILSLDQSFGAADLGPVAMQTFRSLHVCNALCKKLGLSSLSGLPRIPRTRSAVCAVRQRPRLRATPPPSLEPLCKAPQERGRTLTRRTDAQRSSLEGETLKATELLLSSDQKSAKRLLFVGECTHLFTMAAAKLVSTRLKAPMKLEWFSTELCWPRMDSMSGELEQSRSYLTQLGVAVRGGVDATALQLCLPSLSGAVWARH